MSHRYSLLQHTVLLLGGFRVTSSIGDTYRQRNSSVPQAADMSDGRELFLSRMFGLLSGVGHVPVLETRIPVEWSQRTCMPSTCTTSTDPCSSYRIHHPSPTSRLTLPSIISQILGYPTRHKHPTPAPAATIPTPSSSYLPFGYDKFPFPPARALLLYTTSIKLYSVMT